MFQCLTSNMQDEQQRARALKAIRKHNAELLGAEFEDLFPEYLPDNIE